MNVEDFHERLKELYLPPEKEFTFVDVPEIRYMTIQEEGPLDHETLAESARWLYGIAHLVKPIVKKRMGKNFAEPPLECLFRTDSREGFASGDKDMREWRMMIVLIDWVTDEDFNQALKKLEEKRGPAPRTPRLEIVREGRAVQILHVGDYAKIPALCEKLYGEFLPENNLTPRDWYHEIYLNDPARTEPGKRKVVIRQPVE